MKQLALKHYGKIFLTILVLGVCSYFGIPTDAVKDILNSTTVARPAPVLVAPDAGK